MRELAPWDVHPDLTEDRLRLIGETIRDVRHDALDDHDTEKGDSNWGLECRILERTIFRLAALPESADWFQVIDGTLHFVFKVGSVPMRFFRGDAEDPKDRYLRRDFQEVVANRAAVLSEQQGAFSFVHEADGDWFWRIAVETEPTGYVLQIVVFQATGWGDTRNGWVIPLEGSVPVLGVMKPQTEAEDIPPPRVPVREAELNKDEDVGEEPADLKTKSGDEE